VVRVVGDRGRLPVPEGEDQDQHPQEGEGGEEGDLDASQRRVLPDPGIIGNRYNPRRRGEEPNRVDESHERGSRLLLRTWSDTEAALVAQLLEQEGIPCQVVSDVPHSLFPLTLDGLGEVRVLVPGSRYDDAVALIAEQRRRGFEILDGAVEDEPEPEEGTGT
jgi:hypothetical protein